MIIGLTGKYCAGKTSAAKILAKKGFFIVNVDKIGHQVLEDKKAEIVSRFGKSVLAADNSVSRSKLAAIVFNSRKKMDLLNSLLHPAMVARVKKILDEKKNHKVTVIDAALLYQMGLDRYCDKIFIIRTNFFLSLFRSCRRDGFKLIRFLRILHLQVYPQSTKTRKKLSDSIIIANNHSVLRLEKNIDRHLKTIAC